MLRIKKCVKSQFIFATPFLKGKGLLEVKKIVCKYTIFICKKQW